MGDSKMGQYHYTVNLDKKEFINPHKLGDGLKLLEQAGYAPGGTNDGLHLLLAVSSGRGGGDFTTDSPLIGSWGGDHIAVVGDYAEDGDLSSEHKAAGICSMCSDGIYRDITDELREVMSTEYEVIYYGSGWLDRIALFKAFAGVESTYAGGRDGRIARVNGQQYLVRDLLAEAQRRLSADTQPPLADVKSEPVER
jgi:hypothetical protein